MAEPRIAKSLATLRSQVNAAWPFRDKSTDGWIGDQAHAARVSDHNPNAASVVTALDLDRDIAVGFNARDLAERLIASRDSRIKYIISNRQICSSKVLPWTWRPYDGVNAHLEHIHISVDTDPALYDDPRPWAIAVVPSKMFKDIVATVFGGVADPNTSAYDGHLITDQELGVALPARLAAPRPRVRVWNGVFSVVCQIVDVGPWNTNDPYWEQEVRPQAETGTDKIGRKTNRAGIDLTPTAAKALFIEGKGLVDWEFVNVPVPAPLPVPIPSPQQEQAKMDFIRMLPVLMRILALLPKIQDALKAGTPIMSLLQQYAPDLISLIGGIGGVLFPNLSPAAQVEVGAMTAFDQGQVKWVQSALNRLGVPNPPLFEDGQYGPKTKAAIEAFQTGHGIAVVDGWAGNVTQTALKTELNKLPAAPSGVVGSISKPDVTP